jgi:hypothetical protein
LTDVPEMDMIPPTMKKSTWVLLGMLPWSAVKAYAFRRPSEGLLHRGGLRVSRSRCSYPSGSEQLSVSAPPRTRFLPVMIFLGNVQRGAGSRPQAGPGSFAICRCPETRSVLRPLRGQAELRLLDLI